jgi:hypothetical protein
MLPQLHGGQKEEHTDRRTATQHRKQVIELGKGHPRQISKAIAWEATMLSEKFFLVLETLLRSNDTQPDGSTRREQFATRSGQAAGEDEQELRLPTSPSCTPLPENQIAVGGPRPDRKWFHTCIAGSISFERNGQLTVTALDWPLRAIEARKLG